MVLMDFTASQEQQEEIVTNVENLNTYGIPSIYLTDITLDNNDVVYTYDSGEIESNIIVTNLEDGAVKYLITESDLQNEVIIKENGNIILDGYEININDNNDNTERDMINTRAGSQVYDTERCPYGKASDYNIYKGVESNRDVALGQTIESLTVAAVCLIITSYASAFVPIAGTQLGVSYTIASALCVSGKQNTPKSRSLSYKVERYYYKTGKFAVNGTFCAQKMVGKFYTDAAYSGSVVNGTYYNCKEYY